MPLIASHPTVRNLPYILGLRQVDSDKLIPMLSATAWCCGTCRRPTRLSRTPTANFGPLPACERVVCTAVNNTCRTWTRALTENKLATAVRKCGPNGQHVEAGKTAQSVLDSVLGSLFWLFPSRTSSLHGMCGAMLLGSAACHRWYLRVVRP